MAFRYKLALEIVTSERIPELNSSAAIKTFAEEFAKGTQFQTADGKDAKILDSKVEVSEEIL